MRSLKTKTTMNTIHYNEKGDGVKINLEIIYQFILISFGRETIQIFFEHSNRATLSKFMVCLMETSSMVSLLGSSEFTVDFITAKVLIYFLKRESIECALLFL